MFEDGEKFSLSFERKRGVFVVSRDKSLRVILCPSSSVCTRACSCPRSHHRLLNVDTDLRLKFGVKFRKFLVCGLGRRQDNQKKEEVLPTSVSMQVVHTDESERLRSVQPLQ
jgi:hypothetical protein